MVVYRVLQAAMQMPYSQWYVPCTLVQTQDTGLVLHLFLLSYGICETDMSSMINLPLYAKAHSSFRAPGKAPYNLHHRLELTEHSFP